MEERLFWLGFSSFPGVGPLRFAKLLSYFGTAKDAWHGAQKDLMASGLGEKLTEEFLIFRTKQSVSSFEQVLIQKNISYHLLTDASYPQKLASIANPPFVLYTKSKKPMNFNEMRFSKTIGIVGTRKVTDYGRLVTEQFATDLVQSGCVIVSGLALGVDGIAHKITLENNGMTIAVLGCGVDCCNPREHTLLYNDILEKDGVIVSEFPPMLPPSKGSFPSRNRIIAGLSLGVLVTEGSVDSGSLITAHDALKQRRKVFAVPGPITSSLSKGPNALIAKGGKMVLSARDILQDLDLPIHVKHDTKNIICDSPEEQQIVDLLSMQQLQFDELVRKTGQTPSQLSSLLSLMEMKGMIQSLEANIFALKNN